MSKASEILRVIEAASTVSSFAKKTGKSEAEVEKLWKEAKKAALKSTKESDPNFFGLVVTILKKKLRLD